MLNSSLVFNCKRSFVSFLRNGGDLICSFRKRQAILNFFFKILETEPYRVIFEELEENFLLNFNKLN